MQECVALRIFVYELFFGIRQIEALLSRITLRLEKIFYSNYALLTKQTIVLKFVLQVTPQSVFLTPELHYENSSWSLSSVGPRKNR